MPLLLLDQLVHRPRLAAELTYFCPRFLEPILGQHAIDVIAGRDKRCLDGLPLHSLLSPGSFDDAHFLRRLVNLRIQQIVLRRRQRPPRRFRFRMQLKCFRKVLFGQGGVAVLHGQMSLRQQLTDFLQRFRRRSFLAPERPKAEFLLLGLLGHRGRGHPRRSGFRLRRH